MAAARYRPGRITHRGVEVCQHRNWNRVDESIQVLGHVSSEKIAKQLCQVLNTWVANAPSGTILTNTEVLPGAWS